MESTFKSREDNVPAFFRFWGKASDERFHLLPFHCLDVAAVGSQILNFDRLLRRRLSFVSSLDESAVSSWCEFFLALHDIGKFSDSFQALKPEIGSKLGAKIEKKSYLKRHDVLGFHLWKVTVREGIQNGWLPLKGDPRDLDDIIRPWISAVAGHHGKPADEDTIILEDHFSKYSICAATEFVKELSALFLSNIEPLTTERYDELLESFRKLSWIISGLTVLSDWLASGHFKYECKPQSLKDYFNNIALRGAEEAIREARIPIPAPSASFTLADLLQDEKTEPSELQKLVERLEIKSGPNLFVIEEATGAGKTEAAILLAHRLMRNGNGAGIFFALPTMATAEAMFDRIEKAYKNLFQDEPTIVLAHSKRRLVEYLKIQAKIRTNYSDDDQSAEHETSSWLSTNRKKSLLAGVGVGTLDQALLSVLPVKHQSLRLFGLARNILIVDEVHAYDRYMSEILCRLLQFHSALGGSAILLSATIPTELRGRLISSFCRGLKLKPFEVKRTDYPMITCASTDDFSETPFQSRKECVRSISVSLIHSVKDVFEQIRTAHAAGASVCWIRNTVDDAITSWREISKEFGAADVKLFHARFAMCDRLAIENEVRKRFGKGSSGDDRKGKILVATQVVEQSLDLDFDIVISDLAPMELLIQRMGRCHRHTRNDRPREYSTARFFIFSPVPINGAGKGWFSSFFKGGAYVYPSHGKLWLTAKVLSEKKVVRIPNDMRDLVETIYTKSVSNVIPSELAEIDDKAEGDTMARGSVGHALALKLEQGYSSTTGQWEDEARVSTRLVFDSFRIRLAKYLNGQISPWAPDGPFAWELSEAHIQNKLLSLNAEPASKDAKLAVEEAKKKMLDEGKGVIVVPLEKDSDGRWKALMQNCNEKIIALSYSESEGLVAERR